MISLPTGTVSFLFTDIEGSTDLLQHVGDRAYGAILEEHHRLIREAFLPVGGLEVDTQGDAFFVAFPDARGAVAAAVAAQRAVAAHPWPSGVVLRVRMGIHTGEPTLGPGGYVGIDVHRAARICSAGHGGQILLSDRTHTLIREHPLEGVALKDLGEHRLKDLARPEHIFQLITPGVAETFPPLKSLDLLATNLPSLQLTSFIGREREMAEIKRLLSTAPLVTLTGPGGAGKTRMALEVAAGLLEEFAKGVWLAELAPLSDPAFLPEIVATALGVREVPGRPILETLLDYLRPRELLLVLDNCEHLVEACATLAAALLNGCHKLKILATSREGLGIRGERTFRVPSLSSPDPKRVTSVDQLLVFDSVRLFMERAALSNPAFVVTDANARAVAQIVHRLDGIPLAIELAAARVKMLRVEQIARRLDDRFRLLTGGSRIGLPHHQTLRAAVEWGHDLLTPDEKVLFRRLSVFSGGFALEAAESVCAGKGIVADDVLDLLTRLVDKSLLVTEDIHHDIRYRMLETIHEYSRERLRESGEADTLRQQHFQWYLQMAEQAEPELRGAGQLSWLDRLELEHDNLRTALEWVRAGDHRIEAGLQLASALNRFWALRGHLREGREWHEGLLSSSRGTSTRARANATYGAGVLAFQQGEYDPAQALSRESLRVYRELGDTQGIALSLNTLGFIVRNRGDYEQAKTLLDESLTISRLHDHKWALAEALNIFGVMARRQGDHARATAMFEESLLLWREVGDKAGLASSLSHLGVVARQQADYERARALHGESRALRRQLGDKRNVAADLSSLAILASQLGDHEQARALFEESLALSRELGDKLNTAATLCSLGLAAHRQGDGERAAAVLEEGLALSRELGDKLNSAAALCNLGFVVIEHGDFRRALAFFQESLGLYRVLGEMQGIVDCLVGRARVALAEGQGEPAARFLAASESLRRATGIPMPPSDRKRHDRTIAAVQALLSESTFAAAWAQGQTMPLEGIISEAMQ